MKEEDLRAYARRDWAAVTQLKADYWAAEKKRKGLSEGIRIAEELRRQVLLSHPGWPTAEDRRKDLDAHIRLSAKLRSVVDPR